MFYRRCPLPHQTARYPKSFRGVFSAWDVTSFGDPSPEEDEGRGNTWAAQGVGTRLEHIIKSYKLVNWSCLDAPVLFCTCSRCSDSTFMLVLIMNFCREGRWGKDWWMQKFPRWRDGFLHCSGARVRWSFAFKIFDIDHSSITTWSLQKIRHVQTMQNVVGKWSSRGSRVGSHT